MSIAEDRDGWLKMTDEALLRLCRVEACRGTGPGGQKRNKTDTAVRITHLPTGLAAINDESRSQHLNRQHSLRRLRLELALKLRCTPTGIPPGPAPSPDNDAFPLWAAAILDILEGVDFRVSDAASSAGLSTSRLVKGLARCPQLWQLVNTERTARGLPPLRITS